MEMLVVWVLGVGLITFIAGAFLYRRENLRGATLVCALIVGSVCVNTNVPPAAASFGIACMNILLLIGLVAPKANTKSHKIRVFVAGWFGIFILTTAAANPAMTVPLVQLAILAILSVLVASKMGPEDRRFFMAGLINLAIFHSILSVWEYFSHIPPLWGYGHYSDGSPVLLGNPFLGGQIPRTQSTMGHPIAAASVVAVGFLTLLRCRKSKKFHIFAIQLIILLVGILLTGTRSVVLAIALGLAFLFLISSDSRNRLGRIFLTLLAISAVLMADFGLSTLVGDLVGSGSYTNRADAISSVPQLFTRDFSEILWGSGYGSEPSLFSQGFFQQNGFNIVDNQLVTTLATGGIIGVVGLCILFVYAFFIGETYAKTLLVFMAVMLFSFDYLRWHFMLVLVFALFGLASVPGHQVASQASNTAGFANYPNRKPQRLT